MYESFYGLKEKPFTLLPDPDYLYLSPKHQRALTLLEYGMMNHAGFSVICGDTGAGKTTLIRRLLTGLGDDTRVGLITNTHQSFGELLNWVLMAFGLDGDGKSKVKMHQIFIEFLIEQYAQNKRTVLIVDEAQNMGADTLEELRMLSNINADKDQVLQVILAGQPALRDTLRRPELMQFAQRIAVDYYLEALSMEETRGYIHHRLNIAGSRNTVFTMDACDAIYRYSGGTPRLINLLSDTALVYGFAEQSEVIEEQLVHDVVREQHSNSIIPTFNTNQPHATDKLPLQKQAAEVLTEQAAKVKVEMREAKPAIQEEQAEEKQDEVIANLAQRAVKAVSSAEQTAGVARSQSTSAVTQTAVKVESGISGIKPAEISAEGTPEKPKVTPIKTKRVEEPPAEAKISETDAGQKKGEKPHKEDPEAAECPADNEINLESLEAASTEALADFDEHSSAPKNQPDEDLYPIVHIEKSPKKGINMMLLGLVGGMFITSLSMMAIAWMLFGSQDIEIMQATDKVPVNFEAHREDDRRQLEVLQKERDVALAISRALERERDAALKTAEAQKKIRQAELRAAEILAEQERKAEERLQQARIRAKEAERAEARALKRERELRLKAEQKSTELEAQRLKELYEERRKIKALAEQQLAEKRQQEAREAEAAAARSKAASAAEVKKSAESSKSFSSNPCNSPSAKFLSTCKK